MKTFIIYTAAQHDNLTLELAGGIYLVNAHSHEDAAGAFCEQQFPHEQETGLESIIRIDEINIMTEAVIIIQKPIIE